MARIAAFVIGAIAIAAGASSRRQLNIAFLVALAFAVAASANLPTILYSLFWKRFNTRGALWSIYGGLIICVTLVVFSPVVSGKPSTRPEDLSMFRPTHRLPLVPAGQPGHRLDPAGFLLGWLGTVTSKEPESEEQYAEMEVRSLTGAGSEKALVH